MSNEIRFFELNTGANIPSLGLGTWLADPGVVGDVIAHAVEVFSSYTILSLHVLCDSLSFRYIVDPEFLG